MPSLPCWHWQGIRNEAEIAERTGDYETVTLAEAQADRDREQAALEAGEALDPEAYATVFEKMNSKMAQGGGGGGGDGGGGSDGGGGPFSSGFDPTKLKPENFGFLVPPVLFFSVLLLAGPGNAPGT